MAQTKLCLLVNFKGTFMAIHDNDDIVTTTSTAAPTTATMKMDAGTQGETAQAPARVSFHSGVSNFDPIGTNPGSEVLGLLMEKIAEICKPVTNVTINLVALDNNNLTNLAYSCLVVVVGDKTTPNRLAYHTLLIEGSGEKPQPVMHNVNGQVFEEHRVAGDAYDSVLIKEILNKLAAQYPNTQLLNVDAQVVPNDFDVNNKASVHALARSAVMACTNELQMRKAGFEDLNMGNFAADSNLVVIPRFERTTAKGIDGLPRRSDITIQMISQQNQKQDLRQSLNAGQRSEAIADLSAFVDLLWSPVQPQYNPQMMMMGQNPMMFKQKYAANIILTGMENRKVYTVAGVLLALTSIRAVTEANNWFGVFKNNGLKNMMTDIGYLNIEANLSDEPSGVGSIVDTNLSNFSARDLNAYLTQLIRPGAIISMDVPECGPETWYLSVFSAAASNSRDSQRARQVIFNAANQLTNGQFGQHFPQNAEMFVNIGNRVHLGHYETNDGLRDIRDFDYVAIAALTKDKGEIERWSDTYSAVTIPQHVRLAQRKRMITSLVSNGRVNFTGYANRVTFSNDFIEALVKSFATLGVAPRLDGAAFGQTHADRGAASWIDHSLVTPQAGGFFSQGGAGVGGINNYVGTSFRNF